MNSIEKTLIDNIGNPASLFIFPTSTSSSGWADHILRLKGGTVPMNKFIAWDDFKRDSIRSTVQNKKSIPSSLRKIFVSRLIKENAELYEQKKESLFSSLIQTQFANNAGHFAPWLSKILPQLGIWFKKTANLNIHEILSAKTQNIASSLKGDDKDMFVLAAHYAKFLDEHNLFEPAWETPPFKDEGKECFIFFPESLSDFTEYKELLQSSPHVTIIGLPSNKEEINSKKSETYFYTNSRTEIKEAAIYIRALHEKQNIAWDSIAVCIADTQYYEPYVLREFTNRNIPFVKRTSKPLTDYPAGSLFRSIMDSTAQDFSFSSLIELVLNKNLPWKDIEHINNIIEFGIKNNCLYSWTETDGENNQYINVWEDAFKSPLEGIDPESRKYFEKLKRSLQAFRASSSFFELRKNYFIFREQFMDMEQCSEETDLVLSRCISELMELVKLEKDFPGVAAVDPFSFFTETLSDVSYLAQSQTGGVSILPYNTAASSPFDCHIILGANQENISMINTKLNFLTRKKRETIGVFDEDASEGFINLHKYNSIKLSAFFCSEQTFSGFSIPHSKLNAPAKPADSYITETEYQNKVSAIKTADTNTIDDIKTSSISEIYEHQYNGFIEWKDRKRSDNKNEIAADFKTVINNMADNWSGKPTVSATALQSYFPCSLRWLFERILHLENIQIETSLMAENISGTLFHEILNLFLTDIKNKKQALLKPEKTVFGCTLPADYKSLLQNCVNTVFDNFPVKVSSLTQRLLTASKKSFLQHIENCLVQFLAFFADCTVFGSEISYEIDRDTHKLTGKVDCILKNDSNPTDCEYCIIDFKMKKLPKPKECNGSDEKGLLNFQLPMYIKLAEEKENVKIYNALFFSILDAKPAVLFGAIQNYVTGKTVPYRSGDRIAKDSEQYINILNEFNDKVLQFSKETACGRFTVFESNQNNCNKCSYHRICRTTYIINRRTVNAIK